MCSASLRLAFAGVDTSGKAQVYTGGAYAGFNPGAWTLSANLLYSAADTSYTRYMAVPGAGSFNAYGDYTMHAWSGRAQVGYRFGRGNVQFQPFGALEVTRLSLPGYQETAGTSNRSEEHTSELQSLMRNSYSVFTLNKKKQ